MIVLHAALIDLSRSTSDALSALGGEGGPGADNVPRAIGGGGHGSPGLIQLHVPGGDAQYVLLPALATIEDLSAPNAHVLMFENGL